jgi:hypothetical protein
LRVLALFMVMSLCGITVSFVEFGYGEAGIGGKVYARDYKGDYRQVADANVTAFDGSTVYEATFTSGSYYVTVPPGNYLVTCALSGYIAQKIEVALSEGGFATINFYLEQSPEPEPDPEDNETTPVGGYVISVSKIIILIPYFMLAALMVSFVLVGLRLKRDGVSNYSVSV